MIVRISTVSCEIVERHTDSSRYCSPLEDEHASCTFFIRSSRPASRLLSSGVFSSHSEPPHSSAFLPGFIPWPHSSRCYLRQRYERRGGTPLSLWSEPVPLSRHAGQRNADEGTRTAAPSTPHSSCIYRSLRDLMGIDEYIACVRFNGRK